MSKKIIIKVNSNFHHACGRNLFKLNKQRFKEYRYKWEKWPNTFRIGRFPLFIDIELTSVCNLRCSFCATTFRVNKIKNGFISLDTVKRIIDEGSENGLYGVKFNIRGEPLLHPQIHKFVSYAKKKRLIDVYFNTNGMLLTEDVSRKLIDAGLDRLTISAEGYTKKTYERHRVGAKFEILLSNIEAMQVLKKKLSVKHPRLRIQAVMLSEIAPVFEGYKKFWAKRADEVAFVDYKEMKVKKKGIRYSWACPQLWQRMAVFWDGTLLPCNHDDDAKLSLGKIGDISIKDAWNSKKLNDIRQTHKEGRTHLIDACDGCYLRDSEIQKLRSK